MGVEFYSSPVGILKIVSNGKAITEIKISEMQEKSVSDILTKAVLKQLNEYFDGERKIFNFPIEPSGTIFQKEVWNVLLNIPYGESFTYGEVAEKIGNKNASRAVGNAVGKNPILIAIPCHRVFASNGLGGFSAGIEVKKQLLKIEKIYEE